MKYNLLHFDMREAGEKPETIIHNKNYCPFCHPETLTGIVATDLDAIFLHNKYPVFIGTDPYVLIEGREDQSDMPFYSKKKMRRLIHFALEQWHKLLTSGKYQEVIFFKNYGPLSGGTIRHPHMQMIGLNDVDTTLMFDERDFSGPVIYDKNGVQFTVSDHPRIGFWELNIIPPKHLTNVAIDTLADFLQIATDYLTTRFGQFSKSYNIFFYHQGEQIYAKLMPRFATPPIFVGYNLRICPSNVTDLPQEFYQKYGKNGENFPYRA